VIIVQIAKGYFVTANFVKTEGTAVLFLTLLNDVYIFSVFFKKFDFDPDPEMDPGPDLEPDPD